MAPGRAGPGAGDPAVMEGEYSSHTMIALYLDDGVATALHGIAGDAEGALDVGELHVTLAYTGRTDSVEAPALRAAAEAVIGREPIVAVVNGLGRFAGPPDGPDVLVALVDSAGLERLRRDLVDALADQGVELDDSHGFTAHVTLAYLDQDDPGPNGLPHRIDPLETTFTVLTVKYGDERVPYGFNPAGAGSETAERALAAYCDGWARTGGPWTARVEAGALAAVALAEAEPDRPGLAEATLQLGALEGTWATVFDRRDALHGRARDDALKAWADLVKAVDTETLVDDAQDAAARYDGSAEARHALNRTITGYLSGALLALQYEPGWANLRQVLQDAIADAAAEGWADALALAAEQAGYQGFDWATAHADAVALHGGSQPGDHHAAAEVALHAAIAGTATVVGRGLAGRVINGETTESLVAWTTESLLGKIARGVADWTDKALATGSQLVAEVVQAVDVAVAGAMWGLYQRAGVATVNVVTAGDGRVCARCTEAEDHGAYTIFDAPVLPLHYGCRCVIENAAGPGLLQALWMAYVST